MEISRIFDLLDFQLKHYPNKKAFNVYRHKTWESYPIQKVKTIVDQLSVGLNQKGVSRGDKILICSNINLPEWHFIDFATLQLGAVPVPIHGNYSMTDWDKILNEVKPKILFYSDDKLYEKYTGSFSSENIYSILPSNRLKPWEELIPQNWDKCSRWLTQQKNLVNPDDLATIVYTSGSTGKPKGVMLSHKNIVSNIQALFPINPIDAKSRVISFLPLNHIFERTICYTYIHAGASIYYVNDLKKLQYFLMDIQPHFFAAVPRILEITYENIQKSIQNKSRFTKNCMKWAIKIGEKSGRNTLRKPWIFIKQMLADLILYRHWRKNLGGKIKGICVGAAAMQENICRLYNAAGIPVREGYGLSETSPVVSFNRFEPGGYEPGTAGIPIPGVELKINNPNESGEGEILVKGPNVMMGYFQNPKLTQKVIDETGWFRTGDIGKITKRRFLKIVDRKKNIFKTSSGKYIYPGKIEKLLKNEIFIQDALIVGFQRPFLVALLLPDFIELKKWCKTHSIHWTAPQYMILNPKVEVLYEQVISRVNNHVLNHEKIRKYTLVSGPWYDLDTEINRGIKRIRKNIELKNQKEIEKLYS